MLGGGEKGPKGAFIELRCGSRYEERRVFINLREDKNQYRVEDLIQRYMGTFKCLKPLYYVLVKLFANLRINGDNDGQLRAVAAINELPAQFHLATARGGPPLMPLVERALADIPPDERQRMLRRWVAVAR